MYEASLPLVTAAPIAGALKLQSLEVRDLSDTCGWVSGISSNNFPSSNLLLIAKLTRI